MRVKQRVFIGLVVSMIAVLGISTVALAADGSIEVTIIEEIGGESEPVIGANVILAHATEAFPAAAITTNVSGRVVFPAVPARTGYTVTASMPSFKTTVRDEIDVIAGVPTKVVIVLTPDLTVQVEVKGESPIIDLEKGAESSTAISDDFFSDLPVLGREYQSVLSLAPGVNDSDGDGNPNVHGSRDRDFQMKVDGVSNVDPLTGQFMSFLNPDAIEEIEVVDSGADASYGGAVGGFGKIRIKDGGNEFEGAFNFFFRDSKFDNDLAGGRDPLDFGLIQPSILISGPIVKDNVWFLASHEYVDFRLPVDLIAGDDFVQDTSTLRSLDKITWLVDSRGNKLQLQYSGDPLEIEPFDVNSRIPPDSGTHYEQGGPTMSLKWTAPYSPTLLWDATVAFSQPERERIPFNRDAQNSCVTPREGLDEEYISGLLCINNDLGGARSGAFFQDYNDERERWTYSLDGEKFLDDWLGGSHRVKFGFGLERARFARKAEYRDIWLLTQIFRPVGFNVNLSFQQSQNSHQLSRIIFAPKLEPDDPASVAIVDDESRGNFYSLYFSDTYTPLDNLTMTFGFRLSREEIQGDGFGTFDPSAERLAWGEALDACQAQYPGLSTNLCSDLGAISAFTVHSLDLPLTNDAGAIIGCQFDAVVNKWQCPRIASALDTVGTDVKIRERESFTVLNNNLAPRFSVAWDPQNDGRTNISASWGRFFGNTILLPFLLENGPDSVTKVFTRSEDGFITSTANLIQSAFDINQVERDVNSQYNDEWTLSFQREVAPETSMRVRYVNRKIHDQLQDVDLNHNPVFFEDVPVFTPDGRLRDSPTGCANLDGFADCYGLFNPTTGKNAPDGHPDLQIINPYFSSVYSIGNRNESEYQAYILELTRRFYQNWEFTGSYVYSKAIGDAEDFFQALGDDVTNTKDEKGFLAFDQRHVLKLNGRIFVPRWGGFRLGGAFSYQTGLPYSIIESRPVIDYPTQLGIGASGTVYDNSTFVLNTSRTFFPTGQRNDQRNKPFWDFNVNFQKEFQVKDLRATFQFDIINLIGDDTLQLFEVQRVFYLDPATNRRESIDFPVASRRLGRQFQLAFKVNF